MNRTRCRLLFFLLLCLTAGLLFSVVPANAHVEQTAPENEELLTAMVSIADLSPSLMALCMAIAVTLGAIHALSPGHGKALVAAYLVGTRSRGRDAIVLGGIVTLTHTAGVFLLGIAALLASNWLLAEKLLPWLSITSGLVVFGVGIFMLITRIRQASRSASGHDPEREPKGHHHHQLDPEGGADNGQGRLDRRGLWALGVSGGALPCPSALMLLLTAISLNRVAFGLLLLLAFSFGLGAVLTLIGWLFLKARKLVDRFSSVRMLNWFPVASASVIMILGLAISVRALMEVL
jgi:nickel/cobalt transporter (NicO) family protein